LKNRERPVISGNVDVLKKLKSEMERDDSPHLLYCAAVSGRSDAIRYPREIGVKINDKDSGGLRLAQASDGSCDSAARTI